MILVELFLQRKCYVVQTRMRLAKRLIAFKPTSFSKSINDPHRCFHILALSVVDDSRSIATSMHAGGDPARCDTGKFGGLCEQFDERLLPSFWNSEYIDLGNDLCVRFNRWHVSIPRMLRRDDADRLNASGIRATTRQAVDAIAPIACRGFASEGDTELP